MVRSLLGDVESFILKWGYDEDERDFERRAGLPAMALSNWRKGRWEPDGQQSERLRAYMRGGFRRHAKVYRAATDEAAAVGKLRVVRPRLNINAFDRTPDEVEFLALIDAFIERWGYTESEFGRRAKSDPNFVQELRNSDRSPTLRTVSQVKKFMQGGAAKHGPKARERIPLPASRQISPVREEYAQAS